MKKTKSPIAFIALFLAFAGVFAFAPSPKKAIDSKKPTSSYFELVSGGNKLTRTDWVISQQDEDCPTEHTDMPCRILADVSGSNPTVASFNDILTNSSNFTVAYPAKVTYVPEP
jgi:hypothetical protein